MRKNRFNFKSSFFSFLYLTFAGICLWLLISKQYLNYLTPASFKYMLFMTIVMLIFSIVELLNIKKSKTNIKISSSLVILIPIFLIFVPNAGVDASHITARYTLDNIKGANNTSGKRTYVGETMTFTIEDEKPLSLDEANSSNSFFKKVDLKGFDDHNKTIQVDDDQFYDWITTIFADQNKYLGYTIAINGMVFKDPTFMKPNQFVPSRLLMSCCVADTVPAGLIASYSDVNKLNPGDWVKVTGKLVIGEYNGQKGPIIEVEKIEAAKKPNNEYIYPK